MYVVSTRSAAQHELRSQVHQRQIGFFSSRLVAGNSSDSYHWLCESLITPRVMPRPHLRCTDLKGPLLWKCQTPKCFNIRSGAGSARRYLADSCAAVWRGEVSRLAEVRQRSKRRCARADRLMNIAIGRIPLVVGFQTRGEIYHNRVYFSLFVQECAHVDVIDLVALAALP